MSKQGLVVHGTQGSIPEEMELPDPTRCDEVESKDRLKYSSAFLFIRIAHVLAYFVVIQVFDFSYLPLYWCMAGAAFQGSAVWLEWHVQRKGTPRGLVSLFSPASVMAVSLVIDSGLIAMTRQDVQFTMLENLSSIDQSFGGIGSLDCTGDTLAVQACQQQHQWQSFITTQVFQAILLYFILFVLKASHTLAVGGLCIAVFSAITLTASSTLYVFSWMMHGDLLILTLVYAMGVFARSKMTLSENALISVLETHSKNVLRQKVRRCRSKMMSTCAVDQQSYKLLDADDSESLASGCSAQTAPAVFGRGASVPLCTKEDGDCLPATAVAWVENCPAPRSLDTLMPGDRILCYDNIGKGLTYAQVLQSHPAHNSASADWVMVSLKDGTQLTMTADHPVAVQPSAEHAASTKHATLDIMGRRCLRAEDLIAGQDCLMVLKMVATPVASIVKEPADSAAAQETEGTVSDKRWITVTVEQPERHELFVSTRSKFGEPGPPIAVGSSDRMPSAMDQNSMLSVKNTFIDGFEDDMPMLKRCDSAPACLGVSDDKYFIECDLLSSLSGRTTLSGSTESSSQPHAHVKVGPSNGLSAGVAPVVRLTDFMQSKAAGVPSSGSIHTCRENCSPCSFHFTWQRNPTRKPCKASYLCEYCHDSTHHDKWRSKFRKRRHAQPCVPIAGVLTPSLESELATVAL